ncbi:F-box/fbd/LRR-repeat protein [Abeliophyllum distichum]|uniref:F-box/fbd/LRR-repeat protein n=1 Tax=Abeliophyllum distichum TaxID=126358 RepID=A0ABD1UK59_9LAMI
MCSSGGSEPDLISNLPGSIIENIMGCLPLRDAVRTSILSREWRYKWVTCPELVFDFWFDQMFLGNHKLEKLVYPILKLHQGPLIKFALQVPAFRSCPDIDQWIDLMANNTVQDFTLHISRGDNHKLPSRIFTFHQLRKLKLYKCVFNPPLGFKGFNKILNLNLQNVDLVPETFPNFISACPMLERLRMVDCTSFDCLEIDAPKLKFLEFHGSLSCLPSLEELHLQAFALESLAKDTLPKKLPVTLKTLKILHLSDMYFEKIEEISCALCLIRSSPNLQKLKVTAFTFDVVESVGEYLREQKSSDCLLAQLKTVDMLLFSGVEPEMEFVKYLLASATGLEEMAILPHAGSVSDGGESILNELKQFPRASPKAEIINVKKDSL